MVAAVFAPPVMSARLGYCGLCGVQDWNRLLCELGGKGAHLGVHRVGQSGGPLGPVGVGWCLPDAPFGGVEWPRCEDGVLEIDGAVERASVANVAGEGRSAVCQHHANLVETSGVKLDEEVALAGNIGHGRDQGDIEKRWLASRTDNARRRAFDLEIGFVRPHEVVGLYAGERDLRDIPLVPVARRNLLAVVRGGRSRTGDEHQATGWRVQPVHEAEAREALGLEATHERIGGWVARELAGEAGRLEGDDLVRGDIQDLDWLGGAGVPVAMRRWQTPSIVS